MLPIVEIKSGIAVIWDEELGSVLYSNGFFGKPLGLRKVKPGPLERPLVLSLFDLLYLQEKGIIRTTLDEIALTTQQLVEHATRIYDGFATKYKVYRYFREKSYIVKPGMKFGADFVVYEIGPGFDHSKWVVQVEESGADMRAISIVRASRLASSVRKIYLVATIDANDQPKFYSFERVKI